VAKSDLRSQLRCLRASFVPFYGNGADTYYPVMVRPTLGFAMVPRRRQERCAAEGKRDAAARKREAIARVLAGGQGPPGGLVDGGYSDAPPPKNCPRKGFGGLTCRGARMIEQFCRVVRQDRGLYAMWTVTLPPETAQALDRTDRGFDRFVFSLRRRFSEALARACARERGRRPVLPDWAFVVEPQSSGRPHLHFVYRCRSRMGRPWLLSTGGLDRLIANAVTTATGAPCRVIAAGNVQALRKDAGRYLSKYLAKGLKNNAARALLDLGWSENLIPSQWWGISATARALVAEFTFPVPAVFVGWLSREWPAMAGAGVLRARVWAPPAEGAPSCVVGSWPSPEALRWTMDRLAELADLAVNSGRTFGRT
jgi:hypothetical protein